MSEPGPRVPDPRMIPSWQSVPEQGGRRRPAREQSAAATYDDGLVVRPFLLTGGRTRPVQDGLRIETLLFARPAALSAPLFFEAQQIVRLCQRPVSIADLAVAMRVPLGVVRVLVADLLVEGYLSREEQTELSIELIERIRDRVRAL